MFRIPFSVKVATVGAGAALLTLTATAAAFASSTPQGTAPSKPHAAATHKPDGKADKEQRALIARTVFEAEADVLGMKPEELRDALRHGKSIEELANDRGMNKEQFADRLAANLRPRLEQLVDSHKISQAQADRVLDAIAKGHVPGWERHHHHHGGKGK